MTGWLKRAIASWWETVIRGHGAVHHKTGICDIQKKTASDICNPVLWNAFGVAFSDRNQLLVYWNVHKHIEASKTIERFTFTFRLLISCRLAYILHDSGHYWEGNGIIFLINQATLLIPDQEGSYSQDCMKDNTGTGHYSRRGHTTS